MLRALNLNVSSGAERDIFPFRHPQLQLFDKGSFVIIRDNFTFPFFDAENLFRQFNLHVLTHCDLTGQTAALFCLTLCDMRQLGGQNIAATLFYRHAALSAGAAAAAGRGDKNSVTGQRVEQFISRRRADLILRIVVNINHHVAGIHQLRPRRQNEP